MFGGQHVVTHNLPEPALEPIPFDGVVTVSWNNDSDPRKRERGSADPDREVPGSNDFPLFLNSTDVSAA